MTLSYHEAKATPRNRPAPRGLSKTLPRLTALKRDLAAAYAEVTSSAIFRPALLRVTTGLAVGYTLVQLAKTLTA